MNRKIVALAAWSCLATLPALAADTMPMHAADTHAAMADGAAAGGAQASVGEIAITDAWVRATLPGQKAAAGYLTLVNSGAKADRLLSVSSSAFPRIEIHTMKMEGDVMIMRPVEGGLEIPAGSTVHLDAAGGLHLMLLDVSAPLADGSSVEMELHFEQAGTVRLNLPVRRAGGSM